MVSIDPRRVYVNDPSEVPFKTVELKKPGLRPSLKSLKLNV